MSKFLIIHSGVDVFGGSEKVFHNLMKTKVPPSEYALTGIYFFKPIVFEMISQLKPSWRNELEITEAIQLLLDNRYSVGYRFVEGW